MAAALTRRWPSLAVFVLAVIFGALAWPVLSLPLPRAGIEPVAAAVALAAWILVVWHARAARLTALEAEASRLWDAAIVFGSRAEAWLVATSTAEELEAEALRRAVVDRHSALVAATRAHLKGRDPHEDTVVQAMTRDSERKGRHGAQLLLHLATLQREALSEAARRGLIGESRLIALDDALSSLSTVQPLTPSPPSLAARALTIANTLLAVMLVLGSAQRLSTLAIGAFAGLVFIAFEAIAGAPLGPADDPRSARLAAW